MVCSHPPPKAPVEIVLPTPHPLSLSPYEGEREVLYIREASPLFDSPPSRTVVKDSLKGLRPF